MSAETNRQLLELRARHEAAQSLVSQRELPSPGARTQAELAARLEEVRLASASELAAAEQAFLEMAQAVALRGSEEDLRHLLTLVDSGTIDERSGSLERRTIDALFASGRPIALGLSPATFERYQRVGGPSLAHQIGNLLGQLLVLGGALGTMGVGLIASILLGYLGGELWYIAGGFTALSLATLISTVGTLRRSGLRTRTLSKQRAIVTGSIGAAWATGVALFEPVAPLSLFGVALALGAALLILAHPKNKTDEM